MSLFGRTRAIQRDVTAPIRAVWAQPPHIGQVEHLAQLVEGAIGLGGLWVSVFISAATSCISSGCP